MAHQSEKNTRDENMPNPSEYSEIQQYNDSSGQTITTEHNTHVCYSSMTKQNDNNRNVDLSRNKNVIQDLESYHAHNKPTEKGLFYTLPGSCNTLSDKPDQYSSMCDLECSKQTLHNNIHACSNLHRGDNPAHDTKEEISDVTQICDSKWTLTYENEEPTASGSLICYHEHQSVEQDELTNSQELMPPPFIYEAPRDHHNNNSSRSGARHTEVFSPRKRKRRLSSGSTVILSDDESDQKRNEQYLQRSSSKRLKRQDNIRLSDDSIDSNCSTLLLSSSSSMESINQNSKVPTDSNCSTLLLSPSSCDHDEEISSYSLISCYKPKIVNEEELTDSQELMPPPFMYESYGDYHNCDMHINSSRSRTKHKEFQSTRNRSSSGSTIILSDDEPDQKKEEKEPYLQRSPSKRLKREDNMMLSVDSIESNSSTVLLSSSSSLESNNQKLIVPNNSVTERVSCNNLPGSSNSFSGSINQYCSPLSYCRCPKHTLYNGIHSRCPKYSDLNTGNNPAHDTEEEISNLTQTCDHECNLVNENNEEISDVAQIYSCDNECNLVNEKDEEISGYSLISCHKPKIVNEEELTDSQELMPPPSMYESLGDQHNCDMHINSSRSRARRKEFQSTRNRSSSGSTIILTDDESAPENARREQYFQRSSSKRLKREDNMMLSVESVESNCSTVLLSSGSSVESISS